MKRVLKVYASEDVLDSVSYDVCGSFENEIAEVSADGYDRICSNSYFSEFDEIGDSCDDDNLTIVEYRYYYDRDVRCSYSGTDFFPVKMKGGEE